jgi:hypothetical protein
MQANVFFVQSHKLSISLLLNALSNSDGGRRAHTDIPDYAPLPGLRTTLRITKFSYRQAAAQEEQQEQREETM